MKAMSIPGMLVLIGLQGLVFSAEDNTTYKYASAVILCAGWILNFIAIFEGGL